MHCAGTNVEHEIMMGEKKWDSRVVIIYRIFDSKWNFCVFIVRDCHLLELLMWFLLEVLEANIPFLSEIYWATTDRSERLHPYRHRRPHVLPWLSRLLWSNARISMFAIAGELFFYFRINCSQCHHVLSPFFCWPSTMTFYGVLCYANSEFGLNVVSHTRQIWFRCVKTMPKILKAK